MQAVFRSVLVLVWSVLQCEDTKRLFDWQARHCRWPPYIFLSTLDGEAITKFSFHLFFSFAYTSSLIYDQHVS